MSIHIKHQVLEHDGKPAFVVVPFDEYMKHLHVFETEEEKRITFPSAVVKAHIIEKKSLVRAWREYKELNQKEVANRMGIAQASFSRMEKPGAVLRKATMEKIARALEIEVEQLTY